MAWVVRIPRVAISITRSVGPSPRMPTGLTPGALAAAEAGAVLKASRIAAASVPRREVARIGARIRA